MKYFNMFRQPYLDVDTGASEAGASTQIDTAATESTEQNTTTDVGNQQQTEQPKIKVKYNHQEMELPYEEAVAHIQKGMNYEKAIEKTRQEAAQSARDAYIAEQGYTWNDKPITTEAEYKQALKEQEIFKKYQDQGLPDDVVQELVESKRFREQFETEKRTKAEQEHKTAEYLEFLNAYKKNMGKAFDPDTDTIPPEVIEMANKGKPLSDAFEIWHGKGKDARIAELEAKLKAFETNTQNAQSTPGSVTGNGNTAPDFISFETFEANKGDQRWVIKNLSKINESRAKW